MAISKNLGILLASELQVLHESAQDCAKRALATIKATFNLLIPFPYLIQIMLYFDEGAVSGCQDSLDKVDLHGVSLSADRGINSTNLVNEVISGGAKLTGTIPHNKINKHPSISFIF